MIKATKKQRNELYNCHIGVGYLIYKSGENMITQTEFYLKNGIPHYLNNGKPVEFEICEEEK